MDIRFLSQKVKRFVCGNRLNTGLSLTCEKTTMKIEYKKFTEHNDRPKILSEQRKSTHETHFLKLSRNKNETVFIPFFIRPVCSITMQDTFFNLPQSAVYAV